MNAGMHAPVLLQEVIKYLDPQPNEDVIDATVNGGGHAEALLQIIGPNGRLLGIDRDPSILRGTRERLASFGDRAILAEGNFSTIEIIARHAGVLHPHRMLFDLGFSSYHLASGRGFSFQKDEPLDMRYSPDDGGPTAEAIINHYGAHELEQLFTNYGEERWARKIAEAIASGRTRRRVVTTGDLARIIENAAPRGRIHPATRVFQALRIAVNDEFRHIEAGMRAAFHILVPGGRIAVISFHSLEDRIVKNLFKEFGAAGGSIITKKPVTAEREEVRNNPRARSAKLRVVQKNI